MKRYTHLPIAILVVGLVLGSMSAALAEGGQILGDLVWEDLNANGHQDPGELGIPGAVVTLSQYDPFEGWFTSTETTNSDGIYVFENVWCNLTGVATVVTVSLPPSHYGWDCTYDLQAPYNSYVNLPSTVLNEFVTNPLRNVQQIGRLDYDFGYRPSSRNYTTFTQGGWGSKPRGGNPGALLSANWGVVYGVTNLTVGIGNTLVFTSASQIEAFLPQGGTPGSLECSYPYTDEDGILHPIPARTAAGVFAGQVTALHLSLDFSAAGLTRTGLGALVVQRGGCAGLTLGQLLIECEKVLGGDSSTYSLADLNAAATAANECFDNGRTGTFAK